MKKSKKNKKNYTRWIVFSLVFTIFMIMETTVEAEGEKEQPISEDDISDIAETSYNKAMEISDSDSATKPIKNDAYIYCMEQNSQYWIKHKKPNETEVIEDRIKFCKELSINLVNSLEQAVKDSDIAYKVFYDDETLVALMDDDNETSVNIPTSKSSAKVTLNDSFSDTDTTVSKISTPPPANLPRSNAIDTRDSEKNKDLETTEDIEHPESYSRQIKLNIDNFYKNAEEAYESAKKQYENSQEESTRYQACLSSLENSIKFITYINLPETEKVEWNRKRKAKEWRDTCKDILNGIVAKLNNAIVGHKETPNDGKIEL